MSTRGDACGAWRGQVLRAPVNRGAPALQLPACHSLGVEIHHHDLVLAGRSHELFEARCAQLNYRSSHGLGSLREHKRVAFDCCRRRAGRLGAHAASCDSAGGRHGQPLVALPGRPLRAAVQPGARTRRLEGELHFPTCACGPGWQIAAASPRWQLATRDVAVRCRETRKAGATTWPARLKDERRGNSCAGAKLAPRAVPARCRPRGLCVDRGNSRRRLGGKEDS